MIRTQTGKIAVAILGATGTVGQKFIQLLENHPWFEIVAVAASEHSAGKRYCDAVQWVMATPLPYAIAEMVLIPCLPVMPCSLVFSALDAAVAGSIEEEFAHAGYSVVSNAKSHRLDSDVPLIIPEVNGDHLLLIKEQKWKGMIVTNPNCATMGITMALKPLVDCFGVEAAHMVTMQAVSGAGMAGRSLDIVDNVIPYIAGEEEKLEREPQKILGSYREGVIYPQDIVLSAQCNRVPVSDGHLACVSVRLKNYATIDEVRHAWEAFSQTLDLPSAPPKPLHYMSEENFPQPKHHRSLGNGMTTSIGRLKPCRTFDYSFVVLSHNTIRGAAGGAILIGELIVDQLFARKICLSRTFTV